MTYTFFISTASSVTYQVYPLNWLDCSLVDEKEKDQQFYRRKFEGELTFGGKKLCSDFNLFYGFEQIDPYSGAFSCYPSGSVTLIGMGYFSTANGTFNLAESTFTVTPKPLDDYSDWAEGGELEYNILDVATEVTVECNGFGYTHNRWLWDVIEYLAEQIFPGVTVVSNFFTNTTDPVTLQPSKLLYLTIAQKSDIKRPTSSDPATEGPLSFDGLMEILRNMFNVFWTYDLTSNTLTIEHLSRFTATAGLDLTTQEIAIKALTYRRETEDMPRLEKWSWMEEKSPDFKTYGIWYDSPAVDEERSEEYTVPVTTEIEYIQDETDSISDDGFVMLANYLSGGTYYTYQAAGIVNTVAKYNQPLSWSNLLMSYHRHGRILQDGYFDGILREFISAKKTILHEINAIVCPAHGYLPENYITTDLGEDYFSGFKGIVKKAVIKPYGEINFTLIYGPTDRTNEGFAPTIKTLYVTLDELTGEIRSELSEANTFDTYYSVWTNDDTCDVIMIPAGTMIQDDLLTQINPIVTVKYNFTDDSLNGWSIFVNGSTTFDTATEGECLLVHRLRRRSRTYP